MTGLFFLYRARRDSKTVARIFQLRAGTSRMDDLPHVLRESLTRMSRIR
jgi:hypothetical protein